MSTEKNSRADRLTLHIPRRDELWFRQALLADPATMAYNALWFPPNGCLPFPKPAWESWYEAWIGHAPERFYAYLQRLSDGIFVGEVNYRRSPDPDRFDIGIIVCAGQRGSGYGLEGLRLLLEHAFTVDGAACLQNDFETTRDAAYRLHIAAGFRKVRVENGIVRLELTQDEYLKKRP